VVIENGRATGVEIERGGKVEVVKANREVIVSASSFNSPKLLMLSGIGPGEHLKDMGIEVKADRPGVGANLQDHMEFYFQQVRPSLSRSIPGCPGSGKAWRAHSGCS
jgi:choline dehydrogenase